MIYSLNLVINANKLRILLKLFLKVLFKFFWQN